MKSQHFKLDFYFCLIAVMAIMSGYIFKYNHVADNFSTFYSLLIVPITLSVLISIFIYSLFYIIFGVIILVILASVTHFLYFQSDPLASGIATLMVLIQGLIFLALTLLIGWLRRRLCSKHS